MDYKDMKINDLRKKCKERGIKYRPTDTRADLVALLEPIEAVVIEESIIPANALDIDVQALQQAAVNLTEEMDQASTALEEYAVDDDALSKMSVFDIKACEDGIASVLKDVDERRKDLTRMLTAPKKLVDDRCKELTEPLKELASKYAEAREEVYVQGYEAQYQECCIDNGLEEMLAQVPFEKFMAMHSRWLSRKANPVKTQERIADEVRRVMGDWGKLRMMQGSMAHYQEAERAFWDTLDLQQAIDANQRAEQQQARVDAMNRQREENEAWRRQEPVPVFTEVEPENDWLGDVQKNHERYQQATDELRRQYTFSAWLTRIELSELRKWKNDNGIGAEWSFREVKNG